MRNIIENIIKDEFFKNHFDIVQTDSRIIVIASGCTIGYIWVYRNVIRYNFRGYNDENHIDIGDLDIKQLIQAFAER